MTCDVDLCHAALKETDGMSQKSLCIYTIKDKTAKLLILNVTTTKIKTALFEGAKVGHRAFQKPRSP